MIIVTIFVIAQKWKQCKHPSADECIKSCGYPYNGIVFGNKEWIKYWYMLQHGWTSKIKY